MTSSKRVRASCKVPAGGRYERQLWMKQIGPQGQEKLAKASVLIVGAGGLGSPILLYLAAAGVGTLGVVDGDTVSLSNLNRQVLYTTGDIGQPKALVAKERLVALNPEVRIEAYPSRLDPDNAYALFSAYDMVVDATDNYGARYLVSDAAVLFGKPLFVGAISNLHGMAFTVIPRTTACFRCLYPKSPTAAMAREERARGVLGTTAGIIGSIVAQNVLKYIVGSGDWLAGKLLLMDGEDYRFELVPLERDHQCRVCGDQPTITELFSMKIDTRQSSC
ncbi:MAG: HesA/MoeB/ThiF family protein [Candidatus Cryosericum sp.]